MIITRTPTRISFLGGGSDYENWFSKHGGCVLSTTINKYCYVSCRWLPPYFEHKHRIVWSQLENINNIDEIHNHNVRECLRFLNVKDGIVINHDSDIPARSGMGSSSAFTVGLLNALYHLKGTERSCDDLAKEAIYVEQEMIKGNVVGNQDQIACAYGGLNKIEFFKHGGFKCQPLDITPQRKQELESHLMLVYTGLPRTASNIASTYQFNETYVKMLMKQVTFGEEILTTDTDIKEFGLLLNDAWKVKQKLSDAITTPYISFLYDSAIKAGAIGGKCCGAGGGGFLLLFCEPSIQSDVKTVLKGNLFVPFKFEDPGTTVILNNGNEGK